jgi:hypothetical protein
MTKRITLAALTLLIGLGCQHQQTAMKPAATSVASAKPVIAPDSTGKVIVHIVSRNQTITVKSGPHGVVYSIRDAQGKLMLADATPEEFQRVDPVLFNQIQHYIAVQADTSGAIEASGDVRAAPVPFSDSRRE